MYLSPNLGLPELGLAVKFPLQVTLPAQGVGDGASVDSSGLPDGFPLSTEALSLRFSC